MIVEVVVVVTAGIRGPAVVSLASALASASSLAFASFPSVDEGEGEGGRHKRKKALRDQGPRESLLFFSQVSRVPPPGPLVVIQ